MQVLQRTMGHAALLLDPNVDDDGNDGNGLTNGGGGGSRVGRSSPQSVSERRRRWRAASMPSSVGAAPRPERSSSHPYPPESVASVSAASSALDVAGLGGAAAVAAVEKQGVLSALAGVSTAVAESLPSCEAPAVSSWTSGAVVAPVASTNVRHLGSVSEGLPPVKPKPKSEDSNPNPSPKLDPQLQL